MHAEKAIRSLLLAAGGVVAYIDDRCRPQSLPQGTQFPALTVEHISTVDLGAIGEGSSGLMRTRIEVNVLAKDYATLKELLAEVRKACKNKHGSIAGVEVSAVEIDSIGPDNRDDDIGIYRQSIDFLVTYREA